MWLRSMVVEVFGPLFWRKRGGAVTKSFVFNVVLDGEIAARSYLENLGFKSWFGKGRFQF